MKGGTATTATADTEEVRRIVAAAGSSFAIGMRTLPPRRRAAIHAVYAFCRIVDDIADGDDPDAPDASARRAALDAWEEEVLRVYGGLPRTAVGAELARAVARFDLPMPELMLVLDGMRMDADGIVAPSTETLTAYVRRVSGAVGILAMHCFGAWRGPPSERFALNLATGLQLTNILRDVEEDAAMGRLYLPRDVLEAAGVPPDPRRAVEHPGLPHARSIVGARARAAFAAAAVEVAAHSRPRLLPALLMMGPYESMLARMSSDWARPVPRRSTSGKLLDGMRRAARGGR
jgi:presqualene diphosphate synthase